MTQMVSIIRSEDCLEATYVRQGDCMFPVEDSADRILLSQDVNSGAIAIHLGLGPSRDHQVRGMKVGVGDVRPRSLLLFGRELGHEPRYDDIAEL